MVLDIPYIQVQPWCIMILGRSIGGMAWRRILQDMWLSVLIVSKSRKIILSLVVWLRLLRLRRGNNRPLIWTSWLVFRIVGDNRTPYGLLWTDWLNLLPLSVKSTFRPKDYARLYIDEIVRWHEIPLSIVSDRGSQCTSHFCGSYRIAWACRWILSLHSIIK